MLIEMDHVTMVIVTCCDVYVYTWIVLFGVYSVDKHGFVCFVVLGFVRCFSQPILWLVMFSMGYLLFEGGGRIGDMSSCL